MDKDNRISTESMYSKCETNVSCIQIERPKLTIFRNWEIMHKSPPDQSLRIFNSFT